MSMNLLNRTSLIKKASVSVSRTVAVLVAVTGVSFSISFPVLAQLNPHPSIFREPPYNRFQSRPPRHKPGHRPGHRPGPRLGHEPGHRPGYRLGQQPTMALHQFLIEVRRYVKRLSQ